jgi:hypothetical protein
VSEKPGFVRPTVIGISLENWIKGLDHNEKITLIKTKNITCLQSKRSNEVYFLEMKNDTDN